MSSSAHMALAYHKYSVWQFQRGMSLFAFAAPASNEHVLDVGCGTGALTYQFARAVLPHGRVTAIDPDTARLQIAMDHVPHDVPNITWLAVPAEALSAVAAVEVNSFHLIYANYVLHRVQDPRVVLHIIYQYLRPGGRFVMQTMCDLPPLVRELTLLTGDYGEKFIQSFSYMSPTQWQQLFREVGLRIETIEDVEDDHFANLDEFLQWWEATNRGVFAADRIAPEQLAPYRTRLASGFSLHGKETLLLSASKPG